MGILTGLFFSALGLWRDVHASAKTWNWKLIIKIGAALAIILSVWALGRYLWDGGYQEGTSKNEAQWQARLADASRRTAHAHIGLAQDVAHRAEQAQERTITRVRYVEVARQEIAHAPTPDAQFAAYTDLVSRLRDEAAANHARALGNYVSSLVA